MRGGSLTRRTLIGTGIAACLFVVAATLGSIDSLQDVCELVAGWALLATAAGTGFALLLWLARLRDNMKNPSALQLYRFGLGATYLLWVLGSAFFALAWMKQVNEGPAGPLSSAGTWVIVIGGVVLILVPLLLWIYVRRRVATG